MNANSAPNLVNLEAHRDRTTGQFGTQPKTEPTTATLGVGTTATALSGGREFTLDGENYRGADLPGLRFHGASSHTDFTGATIDGAKLSDAMFTKCRFDQTSFHGSDLRGVVFDDCSFTDTDFTGSDLRGTSFTGGVHEALLSDAWLVDHEAIGYADDATCQLREAAENLVGRDPRVNLRTDDNPFSGTNRSVTEITGDGYFGTLRVTVDSRGPGYEAVVELRDNFPRRITCETAASLARTLDHALQCWVDPHSNFAQGRVLGPDHKPLFESD